MLRNVTVLATTVAVTAATGLTVPALAQATPRVLTWAYYCKPASDDGGNSGADASLECSSSRAALLNPSGPTFNPTPEPTITTFGILISYDPAAGVLTFAQTEPDTTHPYDPANECADYPGAYDPDGNVCDDNGLQQAALWANTGRWTLSHGTYTHGPSTDTTLKFGNFADGASGYADWTSSTTEKGFANSMGLSETGVRGTLQPAVSVNGNTIAYTYTSPYLENLNLTEVDSSEASPGAGLQLEFGPNYFPGEKPVPPLPKLPTGGTTPQFKPGVFTVTGDGSAYFGGSTGHTFVPRRLNDIGKLKWTSWTYTTATAVGQVWGIYGGGCNACSHTWQDTGKVTLHAFDPVDGVFMKMKVSYGPSIERVPGHKPYHYRASSGTITATKSDGYYYWG